uniref:Signal recognition particle 14 kDa protein n=1 Tax=Sinocyclocheilus anshuiensis TaxID=1608454 RepID=A0A671M4R9_9TELE
MAVNGGREFEAQKIESIHYKKCSTMLQGVNKDDGRTKPIPRKGHPETFEAADNKCLLRASDGKNKISTVVRKPLIDSESDYSVTVTTTYFEAEVCNISISEIANI